MPLHTDGSARKPRRGHLQRLVAVVITLVTAASLLVALTPPAPAEALDGSGFNAGNIISDGVFYDQGSMSESQIQVFLNAQVPMCRSGYTCLKNYSEVTTSHPADSRCGAYQGGGQSSAAIIYAVSQACGINPQVLLVLLEKEQGLVTDSWPTDRQYRSATGYGCPDTADCDAAYYGFYNQVYNAAHQYKNYQANPNNWSYRAGRANTIQWHPNAACGTSSVYIENQATAALYIYTPYRPNAAALSNLYGLGDSCSSYGNRNFWRIFTSWFGSTQASGDLVKSADSPSIFLIVGSTKHHVPSQAVLESLRPLYPYRTVAASYLDALPTGNTVGALFRDPGTGDIFLFENGVKHRFATCELVSLLGMSCGNTVNLLPSQLAKFPTGGEVAPFVKSALNPTVYYLDSGKKRSISTWSIVAALYGQQAPFIYTASDALMNSYPAGPALLAPGTLVKGASTPDIYMIDGTGAKIPVSSFDTAADLGINGWSTQSEELMAAYPTASQPLTNVIQCGERRYIGGSGRLTALASNEVAALPVTAVSPITCDALPMSGQTVDGLLFVTTVSDATVYLIDGGKSRAIDSWSTVAALNGNRGPTIVKISRFAFNSLPRGAEMLAPGTLVKAASNPSVFLVDGLARKVAVDSFGITSELGIAGYTTPSDARLATYGTDTTPLKIVVKCGDAYFIGGHGKLWKLSSPDGFGLAATALSTITCDVIPHSPIVVAGNFFVKDPAGSTVYQLSGGQKRPIESWGRLIALSGSTEPTIVTISGGPLATIPTGPSA
ncbi:hypothetical protein [Cryobacterium sp. TMT1-66-1]|uniref:hypothetical protein n=1 Tax=Cryobacterium sp. TMT1-66-1 TaxID=1259242 RepID=UPI001580EE7D|nr:hypothetical protein [Cryobacterium sp. TMT1-66-1]